MVQGGSGALGGRTITPQFRNPALGFLSGGMAGAQAGSMMAGGGAVNPMYALGGALLGGLA